DRRAHSFCEGARYFYEDGASGERRAASGREVARPPPAARCSPAVAPRLRPGSVMAEAASFRIVVVDDDPAIRRLVRLFLKRSGYETVEFATGEEARAQLGKIGWDLAILDRRLPDMDGVVL